MKLSNEQQQIVNHVDGPILAVSCPGSGKTTVIINRTKHLIDLGIRPYNILVITFTKEAALEMQRRFEKNFGASGVFFGTIHALCFEIVSKTYRYTKENIMTGKETFGLFAEDMKKHNMTVDDKKIATIVSNIGFCRSKEQDYRLYIPEEGITAEEFRYYFRLYDAYKKKNNKVDFDDMLFVARDLFESDKGLLEYYQDRFQYIMVDEYQDTSKVQSDICNLLAQKYKNICVVGDDDQSIYRFRGAKVETILNFMNMYPEGSIYRMGTNYRSGKEIVRRASLLIGNNAKRYKKEFIANKTENGVVQLREYRTPEQQSVAIIRDIVQRHEAGVPYEENAILYRTNMQVQTYLAILVNMGIPFYTTEAPVDIHDEIMYGDVKAYYSLAKGTGTPNDLKRILNRPMRYLKSEDFKGCPFEKNALEEACRKNPNRSAENIRTVHRMMKDIQSMSSKTPAEFFDYMEIFLQYRSAIKSYAEFTGKNERQLLSNWEMLKKEALQFNTFEEWFSYGDNFHKILAEKRKGEKKGICLSTFHSSKGLEWNHVYIVDATDNICPFNKAHTNDDFEEERRLFYVAMTRAAEGCYISYVNDGKEKPSRYLFETGLKK